MVESKQCLLKYGLPYDDKETTVNENTKFENKWMTLWDVPADINTAIPVIPNKIYCNKDLVTPLEKAFRNIIDRKLTKEIKTWDGCFNIRKKRGLSSMSLHSWGLAIDVNAAWNGLGTKGSLSAGFVKCFTDAGFEWGGNWVGRSDPMHFQIAKLP
jgi:hypothetical protein